MSWRIIEAIDTAASRTLEREKSLMVRERLLDAELAYMSADDEAFTEHVGSAVRIWLDGSPRVPVGSGDLIGSMLLRLIEAGVVGREAEMSAAAAVNLSNIDAEASARAAQTALARSCTGEAAR